MPRGIFTDSLQRVLSLSKSRWAFAITRSQTNRALYEMVKMLAFMSLARVNILKTPNVEQHSLILAMIAVVFCIRGLPFLFLIRKMRYPPST